MTEAEVLKAYDKLAHKLARKYHTIYKKKYEYDDLYQSACLGILKAHRTYDSSKCVNFKTHAYNLARYEINHYMRDDSGLIAIPHHESHNVNVPKAVQTPENFDDINEAEFNSLINIENKCILDGAFKHLSEKQMELLKMIYLDDCTMEEVARNFDISRTTAYIWHNKAIEKLRGLMDGIQVQAGDLL